MRRRAQPDVTPALELETDDVIFHADRWVRVVDEPHTVHRGLGPFDEFQILIGFYFADLRTPRKREYGVLAPDHEVAVCRSGGGA